MINMKNVKFVTVVNGRIFVPVKKGKESKVVVSSVMKRGCGNCG